MLDRDPWPTFLVKECLHILLPSITKLVNCSLSEGIVTYGFKKAIVSPLIEKVSLTPNELKNYRPMFGLSFISKVVERVVASQLDDDCISNGLKNVSLSGYKHGHSTETALLSIKNDTKSHSCLKTVILCTLVYPPYPETLIDRRMLISM